MEKTVYLVDASTFIHRSFHAIRHLATRDGRPTNAVFGFVATLNKLLREKQPEMLAVVYDAKGPSFRLDMYKDYKANRPPMPEELIAQQEPIRKIVAAMGLPGLEQTGLEADDIVAALTEKARKNGYRVVIVSNDKDYYQLLDEKVSMYDPNPKKESAMDLAALDEKFGLKPAQFLDAQGLMGDSTDNIPGVPGVGEKTAVKLMDQFETLENIYENIDQVKQAKLREKLLENKDQAFLSRELARLKKDADLDVSVADLKVGPVDKEELLKIYEDLEFARFAAELGPASTISYDDYHLVQTTGDLDNLVKELDGITRLSVDLETTALDPNKAGIVGLSLAAQPHRAFYIPVGTPDPGRGPARLEDGFRKTRANPGIGNNSESRARTSNTITLF